MIPALSHTMTPSPRSRISCASAPGATRAEAGWSSSLRCAQQAGSPSGRLCSDIGYTSANSATPGHVFVDDFGFVFEFLQAGFDEISDAYDTDDGVAIEDR